MSKPTEPGWYWYNDMDGDPEYSVIVHIWDDGDSFGFIASFPGLAEDCPLEDLVGIWGERVPSSELLSEGHRARRDNDFSKERNDLIRDKRQRR